MIGTKKEINRKLRWAMPPLVWVIKKAFGRNFMEEVMRSFLSEGREKCIPRWRYCICSITKVGKESLACFKNSKNPCVTGSQVKKMRNSELVPGPR